MCENVIAEDVQTLLCVLDTKYPAFRSTPRLKLCYTNIFLIEMTHSYVCFV